MKAAIATSMGRVRSAGRELKKPALRTADPIVRGVLRTLALAVLVLIAYFFIRLAVVAEPTFSRFGIFGFVFTNNWDVARNIFGAWPLVAGTLITATIALVLGVPVAVAAALYVTELACRGLRRPLSYAARSVGRYTIRGVRTVGSIYSYSETQAC